MITTIAALDVGSAATELDSIFDDELDTAALAERRGQKIYRSLKKLSELIGGEYGDRVLYELIQNAHDVQPEGEAKDVAIRLVVEAEDEGVLYVANGGAGFTLANFSLWQKRPALLGILLARSATGGAFHLPGPTFSEAAI
jgi:hypothetical protein